MILCWPQRGPAVDQRAPQTPPTPKDKTNAMATPDFLSPTDTFIHRHLGSTDIDVRHMLATLDLQSLEELSDAIVPADIRLRNELNLPLHRGEQAVLQDIRSIAAKNQLYRSLIGMGYHDCLTPGVIQRNIF